MKDFINKYYEDSIKLKERFLITEKKPWNYLTVLNELNVQLGHVFTIVSKTSHNELYRNINNLGDEISDVFFQLILLVYYCNYNIENIVYNSKDDNLESFLVVLGQCSEALLEKDGLRFDKDREGYTNKDQYIMDSISKMFSIIYNYSKDKIDIDKEYRLMLIDANNFLDKYKK
jgi:hypothetical protein